MKIFLDTADCHEIQKHYGTGLIDGVTTNPSLIMKSHRKPDDVYGELKGMGLVDISMEVVDDTVIGMLNEAHRLVELFGDVTTIKVPCTVDGLFACKELSENGIRVNVTLIFSASQAVLAAKAGASYISPFVGRVEDNSFDGVAVVREIASLYAKQNVKTEVLAASLRDVHSVARCYEDGADIVTMPPSVFEGMYKHILTDKGLDQFDKDYAASVKE